MIEDETAGPSSPLRKTFQAMKALQSWRRLLIAGEVDAIGRFQDDVDARLVRVGWKREALTTHASTRPNGPILGWQYFLASDDARPLISLGLARVTDRRLRGRMFGSIGSAPMEAAVSAMEFAIHDVVQPSASEHGLAMSIASLGTLSRVSQATMSSLVEFSDLADGAWPLDQDQELAWRRFLINVCREDTAFDVGELQEWFVANAWGPGEAARLVERFSNEAALLSDYLEEIRV